MAISNTLKKAYVVFELESHVAIYDIIEQNGVLQNFGFVQVMPQPTPGDYAAEIEIHPNGKYLYVSNRLV